MKDFNKLLLEILNTPQNKAGEEVMLPTRKPLIERRVEPDRTANMEQFNNSMGIRSEDFDGIIQSLLGSPLTRAQNVDIHQEMEDGNRGMVNKTLIDFVKKWEGFKPKAYKPLAHDKWTIGYGRTSGVKEGDEMDEPTAFKHLVEELSIFENDVKKLINKDILSKLKPSQLAALTSLVYNVGTGAFSRSKALKNLNAGDFEGFKREAFDPEIGFVKSGGKVVKGLVNRRQEEKSLFETGEKRKK